ncbi:D-alanyl-D-alanine carboxypeptidase family protein [Cellulomonas soli]|uniref:M15 family metallopeptidase n=1 Tax=Cellulomonas soli TaxID=931535 RepID=UPI003F845D9D
MPVQQAGAQTSLPTRRSRREAERAGAAPAVAPAPVAESTPRAGRVPAYALAPAPATAVFEPVAVATPQPARTVSAPEVPPTAQAPAEVHPEDVRPEPVRAVRAGRSAAAHGREKRRKGLARVGVLGALVGVTVIVPVTHSDLLAGEAYGNEALADATLPTTLAALTASGLSAQPPASLISADGGERTDTTVSRAELREALPGCDGSVKAAGANGQLAVEDLCTLWDGRTKMRADAAVSLAEMNEAYVARFGADMCLSSGYRTLAEQRAVKAQKGSLAAPPGLSNHGWGLAIDFCGSETSGARWTWLNENAAIYGWENPDWAQPGGSGPYERWHWEYLKGVQEDGEYYG